jgi:hypothetical protein
VAQPSPAHVAHMDVAFVVLVVMMLVVERW